MVLQNRAGQVRKRPPAPTSLQPRGQEAFTGRAMAHSRVGAKPWRLSIHTAAQCWEALQDWPGLLVRKSSWAGGDSGNRERCRKIRWGAEPWTLRTWAPTLVSPWKQPNQVTNFPQTTLPLKNSRKQIHKSEQLKASASNPIKDTTGKRRKRSKITSLQMTKKKTDENCNVLIQNQLKTLRK